ncbi:TIGR04222 domain-containing membrane protein [Streptomyces sp. NPDC101160]|uniref:TIGR04222 domain-containing membrane protein n=1 Tax=Streptomyces sp. NPDC101160 TaxID=3366118 RepID=UPI00380059EE
MNVLAIIYDVLGAGAIALLLVLLHRARRGSGGAVHDRYEAAFLNGGPARVVDSALASLHGDGRLNVSDPGIVWLTRSDARAHDPVERAVLGTHVAGQGALAPLRLDVMRHPAVQEIGDGLAARGLIMTPRARRSVLVWSWALGGAVLLSVPVVLFLTVAALMDTDDSVPFVVKVAPALLGVPLTAVACGVAASGRVTPAGRAALASYGRELAHVAEPGLLVALHGLGALPDPLLRAHLVMAARTRVRARPMSPARSSHSASAHGSSSRHSSHHSSNDDAFLPVMWCAAAAGGGGGGCGGGSSCGSGGSSCSGGGSCSGGSSCSSSSSSCSSSSSSCSSSSSSCSSSSSSCSSSSSSCSSSSSSCSSSSM